MRFSIMGMIRGNRILGCGHEDKGFERGSRPHAKRDCGLSAHTAKHLFSIRKRQAAVARGSADGACPLLSNFHRLPFGADRRESALSAPMNTEKQAAKAFAFAACFFALSAPVCALSRDINHFIPRLLHGLFEGGVGY